MGTLRFVSKENDETVLQYYISFYVTSTIRLLRVARNDVMLFIYDTAHSRPEYVSYLLSKMFNSQ